MVAERLLGSLGGAAHEVEGLADGGHVGGGGRGLREGVGVCLGADDLAGAEVSEGQEPRW